MTWTTQTPASSSWGSQTLTSTSWDSDASFESVWVKQNNMVVTHPGEGTFNVTGQTFNQYLFNHKVPMGEQDAIWGGQSDNQTTWRTQ